MNWLARAMVFGLCAFGLALTSRAEADNAAAKNPVIVIDTSMGKIKAELWADKAPGTVANMLKYIEKKHYDGLIFHRVINGFMIQGGGFTPDMQQKATDAPIRNEASADKKHDRGTLAMARLDDLHSATSQFYINLKNNNGLNHHDDSDAGFGYCAFGKVTEGMDVVDKIAQVPVANRGDNEAVPVTPVVINSITVEK
jgi:cyclophilin family peptidyl-prolyl cis-trans isomerase